MVQRRELRLTERMATAGLVDTLPIRPAIEPLGMSASAPLPGDMRTSSTPTNQISPLPRCLIAHSR